MTTQSPHLYARTHRPAAARTARTAPPARTAAAGTGVQTRLPWWAVALPVLAFATLLTLLTAGTADASAAASHGDWFGRLVSTFPDLVHHLL